MASDLPSTTRDDAPAYLARYMSRRRDRPTAEPEAFVDTDVPEFVQRARLRASERAAAELARPDAPPEHTFAYAEVMRTPREIVPPPSFRERMADTVDVRLIRHGQVQGYATDAGLTALGRWQAHRKGQDLARGVKDGSTIHFVHAATARATQTARAIQEGLLEGMARYAIEADVGDPEPATDFRNFQVWLEGKEMDPTAAFNRYIEVLEGYERRRTGDRPGWLVEMERFWNVQAAGGDPITHWLTMPMQYFEPAANLVRRFWRGIVASASAEPRASRVFVCTHSGPIRAVATQAIGHDAGEPNNVEDVRIRVYADLEHAIVTYRGRGVEIEIPTTVHPTWFA